MGGDRGEQEGDKPGERREERHQLPEYGEQLLP